MVSIKVRTRIILIISIILLLLVSTMIYSLYSIDMLHKNLEVQVHTRTIILNLKNNFTNLLNAETGERGYVITGDETYLKPYNESMLVIQSTKNNLRKLITNDSQRQPKLDSLEKYIDLKVSYIDKIIGLKRSGEEEIMQTLLKSNIGKYYMDKIREFNNSMQEREEQLFSQRKEITYASLKTNKNIFIAEGTLAIIITIVLALTIISELDRRMKTEAELHNKNFELVRKNSEVEQFAYISAHDLQEPLRSISNYTYLLEERIEASSDDTAKRYNARIKGAAGRMSGLISDLLEYSRLGNDLVKTKIDCHAMINEVIKDLAVLIKESDTRIMVEKLPVLTGYNSLKSLFQNLITNAIKFSKKDSLPEIKIAYSENQREYIFSVNDNGIGIDPLYFEKIFTIFQRLHTREEYKGTGIGLAQCKKIVELHGGKIWVNSVPDKGSTFYFTIPKV